MGKSIFNFQNKKEWNAHGVAEATKSERIIMNITIWIGFIGCVTVGILSFMNIIPFYWFFIFLAIPFIPFIIFVIRHLFIKKDFTIVSESYNIKGSSNRITGKDNIEITNYKQKINKNNNNEGD